ncbi:chemotaxis protein CheD [Sphingomonas sp. AP4-R1]|uniref:chemotaxis protein CheD n=1 Tax=Sphingomonas sp. AP4-R1 TaxID=2735134 RepID=UPI0020A4E92F|nr:chemotaxis protein CheD [Sphingomonas sp. AP4-R1]
MASTALDVSFTTVLGSCIAVCLHDRGAAVGGMNHFLLADYAPLAGEDPQLLSRYGVHAMELLINAMMHRGGRRDHLKARIYGGASMRDGLGNIGERNTEFARTFLRREGIPVLGEEVGGNAARRIEFLPALGRARCKSIVAAPPIPVRISPPPITGEVELF